jgi:hypothetical protein
MIIRKVGAELSRADRRTDALTAMTKLIVAVRSFANAPKNDLITRLNFIVQVRLI